MDSLRRGRASRDLGLRGVTFLQGWLLPRLGGQVALCKLGSLTLLRFPPPPQTKTATIREAETQRNGGTVLTVV